MKQDVGSARDYPSSWFGLCFDDPAKETAFAADYARRVMPQTRIALLLGAIIFLGLGFADRLFYPDSFQPLLQLRFIIAGSFVASFFVLRTPWALDIHQTLLGGLSLLSGSAMLAMMLRVPTPETQFVGLLLVIAWSYTFCGLRFFAALATNFALFAAYVGLFAVAPGKVHQWALVGTLYLLAASIFLGLAGFLVERQRRSLFFQADALDKERRDNEHRALHDPLTGLPNRVHFEQVLESALARGKRNEEMHAVLFIDLNDFKPINDRFGHWVGDEMLRAIAHRLARSHRGGDTLARQGGDEFVLLLEGIQSAADSQNVALKLLTDLERQFQVADLDGKLHRIHVSASIGIAVFPHHADNSQDLVQLADQAMYEAKQHGGNAVAVAPFPKSAISDDPVVQSLMGA